VTVIFASEISELSVLLEKARVTGEDCFGRTRILTAEDGDNQLLLAAVGRDRTDIGLAFGYIAAKYRPDSIIGIGCCACLEEFGAKIGDIAIVSESVTNIAAEPLSNGVLSGIRQNGRSGFDAYINGANICGAKAFPSSPELVSDAVRACRSLGMRFRTGRAVSFDAHAPDMCNSSAADVCGALFADSSCGCIARSAASFGLPCVFIKGVADFADDCAQSDRAEYSSLAADRACTVVRQMLSGRNCGSRPVDPGRFCRLSPDEITETIAGCEFVSLAVTDGEKPYVVPVGFDFDPSHSRVITLLTAYNGKKMHCIKTGGSVALGFVRPYDTGYRSVTAVGRAQVSVPPSGRKRDLVRIDITLENISGRFFPSRE
jgi:nucleoside phosphorylase